MWFLKKSITFENMIFTELEGQKSKIIMNYAENGPNGSHQRYFHKLVYEVYEDLNTPTHPCNESEVYSKDKCFLENLHDESIKQIGCTTPFGLNKSLICTDTEKAQKALDL